MYYKSKEILCFGGLSRHTFPWLPEAQLPIGMALSDVINIHMAENFSSLKQEKWVSKLKGAGNFEKLISSKKLISPKNLRVRV